MLYGILHDLQHHPSKNFAHGPSFGTRVKSRNDLLSEGYQAVSHDFALICEVAKAGTWGHTGGLGNLINSSFVIPFFGEEARCGVPDDFAHQLLLARLHVRDGCTSWNRYRRSD